MNVTNRPNSVAFCKIFGKKVSLIRYVMPGYGLAQKIKEVYTKPKYKLSYLTKSWNFYIL